MPPKVPEPSHLSRVLKSLNASPRLYLSGLHSLRLTLAQRNDHFGARHFLKEFLPRIQYANPSLDIQVQKENKSIADAWKSELELQFEDGSKRVINLQNRWSTSITKELMDLAGTSAWKQWKAQAQAEGRPVLEGEVNEPREKLVQDPTLPSLNVFLASRPPKTEAPTKSTRSTTPDLALESTPTSGPGAVLP